MMGCEDVMHDEYKIKFRSKYLTATLNAECMEKSGNPVREKSFAYACKVVDLYKCITTQNREYVLSKQFLKSGTSIGANIEESLQAHSRSDFIAKMEIALKDAYENRYWVRLIRHAKLLDETNSQQFLTAIEEIIRILAVIMARSRKGLKE